MTRLRELVKDYDENRQREHPTDAVKHKLIRPRSSAHATENLSRARDRVVGAVQRLSTALDGFALSL